MNHATPIRTGRHCVYLLHAHLVFVAKYRRTIFSKNMLVAMQLIFDKVCQGFESTLIEFEGECDHVHLLVNYPPKVSLSKLINSLKGVSSRRLRQQFSEIHRYYWKRMLWSPSYFAGSCGGVPLSVVKQYIQNQKSSLE
ncbi:MAG TPA: IS200/IS605 family transposase [Gammaproteobacteria bacterium]|nr:IS200/IS605 family transposase [Gammaproteobacteria bacterium]